jgi:hypothetical protein
MSASFQVELLLGRCSQSWRATCLLSSIEFGKPAVVTAGIFVKMDAGGPDGS